MKFFSLFAVFFLFSSATGNAETNDLQTQCAAADVQASCKATCGAQCSDRNFLAINVNFCLDNNLASSTPEELGLTDAESCPIQIEEEPEITAETDCESLEKLTDILACEQAQNAPSCAASTYELRQNANTLVDAIDVELRQYGDLLEIDYTSIDNRDKLCEFSRDDLNETYETASKNPLILKELQFEATGIQGCSTSWEDNQQSGKFHR